MKTLSIEQCRAMLAVMSRPSSARSRRTTALARSARSAPPSGTSQDGALFISLLLCGGRARTWTWGDVVENFLEMPMAAYQSLRDLAVTRKLTLFPFNHVSFTNAHWVSAEDKMHRAVFCASVPLSGRAFTTHEVTRRMKRYARLAGLGENAVTLRTVSNTHRFLRAVFGSMDEAADALGLYPTSPTPGLRAQARNGDQATWQSHLHGIGRRSTSRRLSSG